MRGAHWTDIPRDVIAVLRQGAVLPAHPLALDDKRRLDGQSQRALSRYYVDAGAGGLAVGVHTTQFAIRDTGLYRPVLQLAADTVHAWAKRPLIMIAGAIGKTAQAVQEARSARDMGYHAVLLSLAAMRGAPEHEIIEHCLAVGREMPLIGFYLQTAVGGVALSRNFWTRFAAIENVIAIKVAPFDRYKTLDVAFGVAAAGAEDRITLYTGNDDHIVADLLTPLTIRTGKRELSLRFKGGLLGHWSVWTKSAVDLFHKIRANVSGGEALDAVLALDSMVTDCNSVLFDVDNNFAGCIAGCHEVLRRQGLMTTIHCLDPNETLSPGQAAAIDRLYATYPELNDDAFVALHLARWREG
jgi:dihydrodipicolinate synthase/N-acetylneuraminate lyase